MTTRYNLSMLRNPFVISGVVLLFVLLAALYGSHGQRRQRATDGEAVRTWMVQCPRCNRWKRMTPLAAPPHEAVTLVASAAVHPGAQYRYTNQYKCPFCGHLWQESYLE
ncbi:MAG: hypothetical protein R3E31_09835 [Chloroflexota bacterium]